MTTRQIAYAAGSLGLIVSGMVLALYWFGVGGILRVGTTDLTYILWPASVMLTVGWNRTIPGVMITISSVAINCLMYIAIALLLRALIQRLKSEAS